MTQPVVAPANHFVFTSASARLAATSFGGFWRLAVTCATWLVTSPGKSTAPGARRRTDVPDTSASIASVSCVRIWNCGVPPPLAGVVKSTVSVWGVLLKDT